jgi:hypothetical protein
MRKVPRTVVVVALTLLVLVLVLRRGGRVRIAPARVDSGSAAAAAARFCRTREGRFSVIVGELGRVAARVVEVEVEQVRRRVVRSVAAFMVAS